LLPLAIKNNMKLAKSQHEAFSQFFEKPTREKLRELVKQNIGETDYLDFKAEWPDLVKVSKHILALANSGGGILVIGLNQTDAGDIEVTGLTELKDKVDIVKTTNKYISSNVIYDILDFSYTDSEYQSIRGKMFQVVLVEYSEKILPLLSLKEGNGIRSNVAYIRHGTESTEANHDQLEHLVNLRIESGYSSRHTLDLKEHLDQLQILYKARESRDLFSHTSISIMQSILGNPLREYYQFVEDMISSKKQLDFPRNSGRCVKVMRPAQTVRG
jgi:predicted HTH transcriptional regulator